MLQNIRTIVGILFFIVVCHAEDASTINSYLRQDSSINLLQGSKVTDMPYGYFIGDFSKSSMKAYDKQNFSMDQNKKLFVGYGTYDLKDENCRYLDIPSNFDFKIAFDKIIVIGNNTYGISRDKLSYSACLSKVAQYSGFVYTPKDASDSLAIYSQLGIDKDIWVGLSRAACDFPYKNDEGIEQSFSNFIYPIEACTDENRFTYKPADESIWLRTNQNETHYCAVKINSPDYMRPIKFCMPWWRVERQWKLSGTDDIFEYNGIRYDFRYMQYIMDYPIEKTICSQAVVGGNTANIAASNYEITCNSYYDIKKSPVCIHDIMQEVCRVDECKGYIRDVCTKTNTFSPFKNYDVGYILIDGVETRVKTKDQKETNVYTCPPPPKASDECLVKSEVNVFPYHCPNPATGQPSQCDELASCLKTTTKTFDECMAEFYCEKSYGSTDYVKYDAGGTAYALGGVCKDGLTQVEAPIEIKNMTKKVCAQYDEYNQTTETIKKCTSTSQSSNKTVSTSITAEDAYLDDERCIRINNIEEARPSIQTVFDYTTKGFFKTTIQKAYIDGEEDNKEASSNIEYMLATSQLKLVPYSSVSNVTTTNDSTGQAFCDSTFSSTWMNDRFYNLSPEGTLPNIIGFLQQTASGTIEKCRSTGTLLNNRCEYNTPACGAFTYKSSDDTCRDANQVIKPFNCSDYQYRSGNVCYENKWYNYPIIAISSDKTTCDSYKTTLGFSQNTLGNVFFTDYDFGSLGITQTQITNKNYCIIGGNQIQGDAVFKTIKNDSTDVYFTTKNAITNETCKSYALCFSGDVMTTYANNTETKQCNIHVNDDTGNVEDSDQTVVEDYIPLNSLKITEDKGTFVGDINGYSDVFAVQEYTEGDFGYVSNYVFKLPKNNIVKIDEREVSPIIEHLPIEYPLLYDYYQAQNAQITKNKSPDMHGGESSGFMTQIGDGQMLGGFGDQIAEYTVLALPMMLFGKKQKWGWYDSYYRLYQMLGLSDKYAVNLYGYDPRIIEADVLVWDKETMKSGTMKEGDYLSFRRNVIANKKARFEFMGFDENTINNILISNNEKNQIGWPSIKWYKTSDKKTNRSSESRNAVPLTKQINTIYMGAVNSLSIVVPYKGDYFIKAFDKNNNLLASKVVQEQNFISNTISTTGNTAQTFAKVQMATANDYNIAPGQNKELTSGSCLSSSYVEWGGGVSGAYYEKGLPDLGLGSDCFKSNDQYVEQHSATKITIQALNSPVVFVINLKKPMPYPNRIILVNLMQLENRKYECWTGIEPCSVANNTGAVQ